MKPFLSVDAFDSVLLAWCALVDEPGLNASGFMSVAFFGQFWIEWKKGIDREGDQPAIRTGRAVAY